MKMVLILIAAFVLSGCASGDYAECTLPIVRDAGMGVRVQGCSAWEFKPSRQQQAMFERRPFIR